MSCALKAKLAVFCEGRGGGEREIRITLDMIQLQTVGCQELIVIFLQFLNALCVFLAVTLTK